MDNYVTGSIVKQLREKQHMTQSQLAKKLSVSDKTISKWETGKGLPDISLIEPLASALGISIPELLNGKAVVNANRSANIMRSKFYVCPICGNIIHTVGEISASCCGITLPVLTAEIPDNEHLCLIEYIDNEIFVKIDHPMDKNHFISFIGYVTDQKSEIVKMYPQGNAESHFSNKGSGLIFWYCNHHGLFYKKFKRKKD